MSHDLRHQADSAQFIQLSDSMQLLFKSTNRSLKLAQIYLYFASKQPDILIIFLNAFDQ